jgi:hypothetical protein
MSATYIIDQQRKMVLGSARGILTFADITGRTTRLKSDPDFAPEYRELFDFTGVTQIELSNIQIQALAQWSPFAPSSRRAFLVDGQLAFALARMSTTYHELNGEQYVSAFRDKEEALRWLEAGEHVES